MAQGKKSLAILRVHAPAVPYAACIACGQLAAWAAGSHISLAIVVVLAFLLAVRERGRVAPHAALLVGVVSCLPALFRPLPGNSTEDRSTLVLVSGDIRRSQPGQVTFEAVDMLGQHRLRLTCRAVELPWRNAGNLQPGDMVWVRGRFEPVERQLSPWAWESWLWRRGISWQVKARFISRPVAHTHPGSLSEARAWLKERVERLAPNRRGAAVLLSMALGYRDVLSEPVERAFTSLGLTHLLVVSGYQVSMVFAAVYGMLVLVGAKSLRVRGLRAAVAAVSLSAALAYVLFIGAEMSATRAIIAATCACLEVLCEGGRRFAQRWGVALLIMQILWPWAILEVGVQLTFAALAGIGLGAVLGFGSATRTFLWVQLSVWLLTSTIVAAWSGTVSLSGLLLNVLAASAWSAFNCTVGLLALTVAMIHGPFGLPLLEGVMRANEALTATILVVTEWTVSRWELVGTSRWLATGLLFWASAAVARLAHLRHRAAMIVARAH